MCAAGRSVPPGRDPASLRRHNLRALLSQLHLWGAASRSALATELGLTRSAIADLIGELTDRGLVQESTNGGLHPQPRRGRPSLRVVPRSDQAYVLGISVEVETLHLGRIGLGGEVLEVIEAEHQYSPGDPAKSVAQLGSMVAEQLRGVSAPPLAIGVAVPGLVRSADQMIPLAPNLGWQDVDLRADLRRDLARRAASAERQEDGLASAPPAGVAERPIVIGNEARLAGLAEHRRGAGRGCSDLVYISAEVGVGGGIIAGNRPLTGHDGFGGEIGHMVTNPGGRACRCGRLGCWETEIGADALLRHAGLAAEPHRLAALAQLMAAVERQESWALAGLRALCPALSVGLANLISAYNPERIILGGLLEPVMRHAGAQLRSAVAEYQSFSTAVNLTAPDLGDQARILGAAEIAVDSFLDSFEQNDLRRG